MDVTGNVYFNTDVIDYVTAVGQSEMDGTNVQSESLTSSCQSKEDIYQSSDEHTDLFGSKCNGQSSAGISKHGDQSASRLDWWQLSMSEYFVPDMTEKSAVRALRSMLEPLAHSVAAAGLLATGGAMATGGLLATGGGGIWLCPGFRNSLLACHGTLTGLSMFTHWSYFNSIFTRVER